MKALKFKLDRRPLEIIYMSFIRPCIEYADILFAGTYDSDLCKLDRLQVEAMRVVTGATARSNIALLFHDLNWESLQVRREVHCQLMMYKILHGLAPNYLQDLVPDRIVNQEHRHLRSQANDLIRVPFARTESYRRSFIPFGIRQWNSLSREVRSLPSFEVFKRAIRPREESMSSFYYYGERWPNVHHARLRIGCSKLNNHLFNNLHVIQSAECACGHEDENPFHFFFACPMFDVQRAELLYEVAHISNNICVNTLLYGDINLSINNNNMLFAAVHNYLTSTERFV